MKLLDINVKIAIFAIIAANIAMQTAEGVNLGVFNFNPNLDFEDDFDNDYVTKHMDKVTKHMDGVKKHMDNVSVILQKLLDDADRIIMDVKDQMHDVNDPEVLESMANKYIERLKKEKLKIQGSYYVNGIDIHQKYDATIEALMQFLDRIASSATPRKQKQAKEKLLSKLGECRSMMHAIEEYNDDDNDETTTKFETVKGRKLNKKQLKEIFRKQLNNADRIIKDVKDQMHDEDDPRMLVGICRRYIKKLEKEKRTTAFGDVSFTGIDQKYDATIEALMQFLDRIALSATPEQKKQAKEKLLSKLGEYFCILHDDENAKTA